MKPTGNPPGDTTRTGGYTLSDFAGTGQFGFTNGAGSSARFNDPYGVATDAAGNVYVADSHNNSIRKITPDGMVSTLTGNGSTGTADGDALTAQFNYPEALVVDANGNIYVADTYNNLIRKVTPGGTVSTIAGDGVAGFKDGIKDQAEFNAPSGITIDSFGDLIVTDNNNQSIRKVNPGGVVTTLPNVTLNGPHGIVFDENGTMYVVESGKHVITKIVPGGVASTFAGTPNVGGFNDGPGAGAEFFNPEGLAIDKNGSLYVGDLGNHRIRKITPAGVVSTVAGGDNSDYKNGPGPDARFFAPSGITVDASGNLYVADVGNYRIRKIK